MDECLRVSVSSFSQEDELVIAIGNNCRFNSELTVELTKSISQYDGQSQGIRYNLKYRNDEKLYLGCIVFCLSKGDEAIVDQPHPNQFIITKGGDPILTLTKERASVGLLLPKGD